MEDRQQRRFEERLARHDEEEYHRQLANRRYRSTQVWLWIGVTVLVVLLMLWLTIFEFWQA